MSMSTNIEAFKDKDKDFQKHKKVLITCLKAKVTVPKETADYFKITDFKDLDAGDIDEFLYEKLNVDLIEGTHYNEILGDAEEGFEVFIKKLPKEVTRIRFTNSY